MILTNRNDFLLKCIISFLFNLADLGGPPYTIQDVVYGKKFSQGAGGLLYDTMLCLYAPI